jgi:HAD superfamily hydrolase (TIGR01484 family)
MKSLSEFHFPVSFLLTDIDDTLTDEGLLGPEAYEALWRLHGAGIQVIPVTGRPAGWCELIARQWPVAGVVGENGGFYFRYHQKEMQRYFVFDPMTQAENRRKLDLIREEVLRQVPGCAVASDQFCRLMDLAIDFCEDVTPLPRSSVQKIVDIFHHHGAQAKISSIHVNGWFGTYDKLTTSLHFLKKEFGLTEAQAKTACTFVGDSPNDEPMFQFFPLSCAVANFKNFADQVQHRPGFIASLRGGQGFAEITDRLLESQHKK